MWINIYMCTFDIHVHVLDLDLLVQYTLQTMAGPGNKEFFSEIMIVILIVK
jgi:hypothetical protein